MPRSNARFSLTPARSTTAWVVLSASGLFCAACESTPKAADARRTAPSAAAAHAALPPAPPAPRRVVFADEPEPVAAGGASDGLVGALASSYDADLRALQDMQARREAARRAAASMPDEPFESPDAAVFQDEAAAHEAEVVAEPASAPGAVKPEPGPPTSRNKVVRPKPSVTPTPKPPPAEEPAAPAPTAPTPPPEAPKESAGKDSAGKDSAAAPAAAPAEGDQSSAPAVPVAANSALMLPPPMPTDSQGLSRLLAASLVRESAESDTPLQPWFSFAALAVANPDIDLPEDFGTDLLPEERDRVRRAFAAFAALGRSLRDGKAELDESQRQALVAALTAGPRFTLPKVELCTRVESFGKFLPLADKRFAARATTRFIVYAEVGGFTSRLEEGRFLTRLTTRVSIESERDGLDLWVRSPEWTPVVDKAEVRRTEFFVGEIVTLSDQLPVGRYLLRIEAKDEATGAISVSKVPFELVEPEALTAATP